MLTSGINFFNFKKKIKNQNIKKNFLNLVKDNIPVIQSLSKNYKDKLNWEYLF